MSTKGEAIALGIAEMTTSGAPRAPLTPLTWLFVEPFFFMLPDVVLLSPTVMAGVDHGVVARIKRCCAGVCCAAMAC